LFSNAVANITTFLGLQKEI